MCLMGPGFVRQRGQDVCAFLDKRLLSQVLFVMGNDYH